MKNDLIHLILKTFLPIIKIKLSDFYGKEDNSDIIDYRFYYSSGGLWNLLIKWLEDGAKLSPEEMSNITIKIIESFKQIS